MPPWLVLDRQAVSHTHGLVDASLVGPDQVVAGHVVAELQLFSIVDSAAIALVAGDLADTISVAGDLTVADPVDGDHAVASLVDLLYYISHVLPILLHWRGRGRGHGRHPLSSGPPR